MPYQISTFSCILFGHILFSNRCSKSRKNYLSLFFQGWYSATIYKMCFSEMFQAKSCANALLTEYQLLLKPVSQRTFFTLEVDFKDKRFKRSTFWFILWISLSKIFITAIASSIPSFTLILFSINIVVG